MEKRELEEGRKLELYIESLNQRIRKLEEMEKSGVHISYISRISELKSELAKVLEQSVERRLGIQEYIANIPDITMQLIFNYRYLEGMRQEDIGKRLHMDRSTISKKIDAYLKENRP